MRDWRKLIHHLTNTFPEVIFYYVVVLVTCGLLYSYFEDKTFLNSMWWACVTGLTIGYGDMYPVTHGGKLIALVLMHVVPLIIIPLIITRLLTSVVLDKDAWTDEEQEQLKADIIKIKKALKIDEA
ncbi:MAG: two pore domain potassium channel family protein [Acidobacteria bacterium]|nr:two pore domain potassium channel family protein [Acidobacteriota bacterium]